MNGGTHSFTVRTRLDGDGRRYPGEGNRHERRKAAAEQRRSGVAAPTKLERFTFRLGDGETLVAGDAYVPPAVRVDI